MNLAQYKSIHRDEYRAASKNRETATGGEFESVDMPG
jgi:hypothetical protein